MRRYRSALRAVVAKEAKAYGFAVVVWSTGALLISARGRPTTRAVLVFAGAILLAHALNAALAFGSPTNTWRSPSPREYVWTIFEAPAVIAAVLLGWALVSWCSGLWAYLLAPFAAVLGYQLLLGLESMLLRPPEGGGSN
ncbi:MAG TPA: hypothetical protein VHC67_15780 [Gaiellaceae bacterium]|jgi:hypothetical protein|nr:hypothetical protein [Gaiellaceae bacterium]